MKNKIRTGKEGNELATETGNIPFWSTTVPDRSVGVTTITLEQFRHLPSEVHRTAVRILIQQGEWKLAPDGKDINFNSATRYVAAGECHA